MKIFLDSANLDEIKEASLTPYFDGLTTNPSLVSATGHSYEEISKQILETVKGEVSLEVIATDYEAMISEAEKLHALGQNVVVKLPTTEDGLQACRYLSDKGIKVNMTLIFSVLQALLAAKAGAYYVSIFVGRLDDSGAEGEEVVAETREILDYYDFDTQLLFASVRSLEQVKYAALLGADIVTVPFEIFTKMHKHPMTDVGLEKFLADYATLQK